MDKLYKGGITPKVLMHVLQPSVIVDWIESRVGTAALQPEPEECHSLLKHSRLVHVLPDPQVFPLALVKLSITPEIRGLEEIMESGYPFVSICCP